MLLQLDWNNISDLLINANDSIVFCMPAIHEEWVIAIEKNENRNNLKIKACISNTETAVRNGYGGISSIEKLKRLNATIQECDKIKINYMRIDDESYLIFLESRMIEGDPKGLNAFNIEDFQATKIEQYFFIEDPALSTLMTPIGIEAIEVKPLDEKKFNLVKQNLEKNPPIEPDLKRQVSIYNSLFQYAEIHSEGINLQAKSIEIPKEAMSFTTDDFRERIKTKYELFNKSEVLKWNELADYKSRLELLRKSYLMPCSLKKNRSILKISDRAKFFSEFKKIEAWKTENIKKLEGTINNALQTAKESIKNEISKGFRSYPTDELKKFVDPEAREKKIEKLVSTVIAKMKFPTTESLLNGFKLDVYFADLTIEDIQDQELIDWFKEKKLIDDDAEAQIANFRPAYEARK